MCKKRKKSFIQFLPARRIGALLTDLITGAGTAAESGDGGAASGETTTGESTDTKAILAAILGDISIYDGVIKANIAASTFDTIFTALLGTTLGVKIEVNEGEIDLDGGIVRLPVSVNDTFNMTAELALKPAESFTVTSDSGKVLDATDGEAMARSLLKCLNMDFNLDILNNSVESGGNSYLRIRIKNVVEGESNFALDGTSDSVEAETLVISLYLISSEDRFNNTTTNYADDAILHITLDYSDDALGTDGTVKNVKIEVSLFAIGADNVGAIAGIIAGQATGNAKIENVRVDLDYGSTESMDQANDQDRNVTYLYDYNSRGSGAANYLILGGVVGDIAGNTAIDETTVSVNANAGNENLSATTVAGFGISGWRGNDGADRYYIMGGFVGRVNSGLLTMTNVNLEGAGKIYNFNESSARNRNNYGFAGGFVGEVGGTAGGQLSISGLNYMFTGILTNTNMNKRNDTGSLIGVNGSNADRTLKLENVYYASTSTQRDTWVMGDNKTYNGGIVYDISAPVCVSGGKLVIPAQQSVVWTEGGNALYSVTDRDNNVYNVEKYTIVADESQTGSVYLTMDMFANVGFTAEGNQQDYGKLYTLNYMTMGSADIAEGFTYAEDTNIYSYSKTYDGVNNLKDISVKTVAGDKTGSYYVRAAEVVGNGNYEVNALATATFTVSKAAAPVINATAEKVVYTGSIVNPVNTVGYTVTGLVAGDEALADKVSVYSGETILGAGTYKVGLVLKGLENYEDAETVIIDVTVDRADREISATARMGYGYIEIAVNERDAVEYSFDGQTFTALASDGRISADVAGQITVYLRYKQTENYNQSETKQVVATITYDVLEEYVGRNYLNAEVSFENANEIAVVLGWQDNAIGEKSDTYEVVVGGLQSKYEELMNSAKETVVAALNAGATLSGYQKLAAAVISVSVGGLSLAVGAVALSARRNKKRNGGCNNEK